MVHKTTMAKLTKAQQADIELYNSLIDLADEADRHSMIFLKKSNAFYAEGNEEEGMSYYEGFEAQCDRKHRYTREASAVWNRLVEAKVVNGSTIIAVV